MCGVISVKKTTKRIIIGSSVVAAGIAAAGALSYAITHYMVKIALDREQPKQHSEKSRNVLAGSAMLEEFVAHLQENAESLRALSTETVRVTAEDGVELVGHLYRTAGAKRTVLAMHGWRSSWDRDFGMIAPFWHNSGCNVLYVEQRGQGESGGDYMGFGMLERHDCLCWSRFLNENGFDGLPLYLAGVSMGAATVLMSASLDLPENVRGIMADCGFTSAGEIWRHVARKNMHLPYTGLWAAAANDLCRRRIQMGAAEYSTLQALKESRVPVLLIHGTDDHFVPVQMTYENYKACTAPKQLFVVPGADHGMSYYIDRQGYEAAMRGFWNDFDNEKPAIG